MKNVLILLVFCGLYFFSATPSSAHTNGTGSTGTMSLSTPAALTVGILPHLNPATAPLCSNRIMSAMDLSTIVVMSDTPSISDSTELEDSVTSSWEDQLETQFGDIGNMLITYFDNFLDNTVEPWVTTTLAGYISDAGGAVTGGLSSLGGDIKSAFSWLGTKQKGHNSTLSIPTDSSVVAANGIGTTGSVGASSFILDNNGSANTATINISSTLGQPTTYTIPDPGTPNASFVLDQGNQSFSGNRTFSGNVTITSLSTNQAVATNGSKQLVSLGYGSTNAASTLVERDASGNFAGAAITATHLLSSGSTQTATVDGTIVTTATVAGSDVSGTITLTTAASSGEGTVTVPFGASYTGGGTPIVVVTPASLNAQQGGHITGYYVVPSSGNFILNVNDDGTGVTSAVFDYIVIH
jgi:hypothetical protein